MGKNEGLWPSIGKVDGFHFLVFIRCNDSGGLGTDSAESTQVQSK